MSLAALNQVYDETRRLAIAGSALAPGDFRLKKLVSPLKKSGEKAPVFAKVAEAAENLIDSPEKESPERLLELSTLVIAVLYTQGETGAEGKLQPLETVELSLPVTGVSARVLKPLIEALTTTGSGRLEIIRDAYERGAFRDLRLVNPALRAIDDVYGEIGDLVADKALPMYGKSIYPQLRSEFDVKGRGGHVRRLRLMNRLDPQATEDLVEEALEKGSKEMKVAALGCLRDSRKGIPHLLEQAKAKAKDIRQAALRGLANFKTSEAVGALIDALRGRDLDIATAPAAANPSPKLLNFLLEEGQTRFDEILAANNKTARANAMDRFCDFVDCFAGRTDKKSVDFLSGCFERRDEIVGLKGGRHDGEELVAKIAGLLVRTESKPVLDSLADSHEGLPTAVFGWCFLAALATMTPQQAYDAYSPYLLAKTKGKRRTDPAVQRRETVVGQLNQAIVVRDAAADEYPDPAESFYIEFHVARQAKLDPRWLDAAIEADELDLVVGLVRPKHNAADAYLAKKLAPLLKKSDPSWEVARILEAMIRAESPNVTERFVDAAKRCLGGRRQRSQYYHTYWLARLIPDLPQDAVEPLERLILTLPERIADELLPYLSDLKSKS